MNRYIVSIPVTGAVHVEVEANTRGEAKEKAWNKIDEEGESAAGDIEWEFHECVTEGNVTHAMLNEIVVSEVK